MALKQVRRHIPGDSGFFRAQQTQIPVPQFRRYLKTDVKQLANAAVVSGSLLLGATIIAEGAYVAHQVRTMQVEVNPLHLHKGTTGSSENVVNP